MFHTAALVALAQQMGLTPAQAVYLPAAIDLAAETGKVPVGRMIWICQTDAPVREYLASCVARASSSEA